MTKVFHVKLRTHNTDNFIAEFLQSTIYKSQQYCISLINGFFKMKRTQADIEVNDNNNLNSQVTLKAPVTAISQNLSNNEPALYLNVWPLSNKMYWNQIWKIPVKNKWLYRNILMVKVKQP